MKSKQESSWRLIEQPDLNALQSSLLTWCNDLIEEAKGEEVAWLLDAIDQPLGDQSKALVYLNQPDRPSGEARLISLQGKPLTQPVACSLGQEPLFWWQFPAGRLRKQLKKSLGLRSLQPLVEVKTIFLKLACRDDEGKTLVRLTLSSQESFRYPYQGLPGQQRFYLTLSPLRGYEQEAHQALESLASWLKEPAPVFEPAGIYAALDLEPSQVQLPDPLPLKAEQATEQALRDLGLLLFKQMRHYEEGVLDDRDTECLHQYRVHLRRLRSIFGRLKAAFPQTEWRALQNHLAFFKKLTGPVRDLDVFLLQEQPFLKLLPEAFRPALQQLFKQVEQERNQAYRQLRNQLVSAKYTSHCQALDELLRQPAQETTRLGQLPIRQVADQTLWKGYKKICKKARKIDELSPDEQLHQLRLECKKLRYLMDFFAALYPSKKHRRRIKQLKRLQQSLGYFNDLSVQQQLLLKRLQKDTTSDLDAALHGLITLLYQNQQQAKQEVLKKLADFSATKVRTAFKACYHQSSAEAS